MKRKKTTRKYQRKEAHPLQSRSDDHFLRRWKELGYDKQEEEYYRNPIVYAPTTANAIHRYSETFVSGIRLVPQMVRETKIV